MLSTSCTGTRPASKFFHLQVPTAARSAEVLDALRQIQDPDLGRDIVACGFVKNLEVGLLLACVAHSCA